MPSEPAATAVPKPGAEGSSAPQMSRHGGYYRTIALTIAAGLFMEQLDSTVLSTALPVMSKSFGTSPLHMSVALTSYLISLAIFIPASGQVADRFGARHVFRVAIGIFVLGSILCGLSPSLWFLVAARLLQGLGGAMMVPVGRLVLMRSVAKSDLVQAMTWILVPALIGPILGPPLGGFIVTYLNWRWIFYINVPIGVLGFFMASRHFQNFKAPHRVEFDIRGLVFSGISLAALIFGFEMASRGAASLQATGILIAIGLIAGALYVLHARRHPAPVLDFRLMHIPTFRFSVIGGSMTRLMGGAMPFLLPMMMQLGFGMSAAKSGAITFTAAAGALTMKVVSGPVLRRFGMRRTLMWSGLCAGACVLGMAAFRPAWPLPAIYAVLLTYGFFVSLQFTAYNALAYDDIPQTRMSAATSFYTTFQQVMLSAGIVVAAATLSASMALRGHTHAAFDDFSAAFIVVASMILPAAWLARDLPRNAGQELTGHREAE